MNAYDLGVRLGRYRTDQDPPVPEAALADQADLARALDEFDARVRALLGDLPGEERAWVERGLGSALRSRDAAGRTSK